MPVGPTHDAGAQGPPPKAAAPLREPSESSENCSPQPSLAGAASGGEDVAGDEPSDAAEMEQSVDGDNQVAGQTDGPKASDRRQPGVNSTSCQREAGGKEETRAAEDEKPGSSQEGESLSSQDVPPTGSGGTPLSEEAQGAEGGRPGEEQTPPSEAMGKLGKGLALLLAKQRRRGGEAGETLEEPAAEGGGEVGGGAGTAAEKLDSVDGGQDRLGDTGDDDSASPGEAKAGSSCSSGNPKHAAPSEAEETAGGGQPKSQGAGVEPAADVPQVDEKKEEGPPASEIVSVPPRTKSREGEGDEGNGARLKGPRRRAMLAPPMSPPKMVAGPENDPQLDCTLNTLEAVHGAFYSPENNHHGHPR